MDDIFLLEILRGCPKALQNTLLLRFTLKTWVMQNRCFESLFVALGQHKASHSENYVHVEIFAFKCKNLEHIP